MPPGAAGHRLQQMLAVTLLPLPMGVGVLPVVVVGHPDSQDSCHEFDHNQDIGQDVAEVHHQGGVGPFDHLEALMVCIDHILADSKKVDILGNAVEAPGGSYPHPVVVGRIAHVGWVGNFDLAVRVGDILQQSGGVGVDNPAVAEALVNWVAQNILGTGSRVGRSPGMTRADSPGPVGDMARLGCNSQDGEDLQVLQVDLQVLQVDHQDVADGVDHRVAEGQLH